MLVRQVRSQSDVEVAGTLPSILTIRDDSYITTTIFVKYNYIKNSEKSVKELDSIIVVALPNGILQENYNPTAADTIWLAGRNAPTLGEAFRVRLSFPKLQEKARWRVQKIPLPPKSFTWES